MFKLCATNILILNSIAVVRADYESARLLRRSIPRVPWSLSPTIIDSFFGDISYSFWYRPFYNENNLEIIKTSVWSNVLIILFRQKKTVERK